MDLGDRMKDFEHRSRSYLPRKLPAMIRVDGRAFHTLTKSMSRPFDGQFARCMWAAAVALAEQVQGCRLAYVQSDEISLFLADWEKHNTDAFFDYQIQKVCSITAAIATEAFNLEYRHQFGEPPPVRAQFDSRCWTLPVEEVTNYFVWRQRDAVKNSITMLAQAHFSHKALQGKNSSDKQDMLMGLDTPVNWNNCEVWQKRGLFVRKFHYTVPATGDRPEHTRTRWALDQESPILSKDRDYCEELLEQYHVTREALAEFQRLFLPEEPA